MPSETELEDTLAELADYVNGIGDELIDAHDPNVAMTDEKALQGHRCLHGENIYIVGGHPDHRYVDILFFAALNQSIAQEISEEEAEEIIEESPLDQDFDDIRLHAAEVLLNEVSDDTMDTFKSRLYLIASGSTIAFNPNENAEGTFLAFHINRKIYPFEDSFGIADFNDAVQSVISAGVRGTTVLSDSFYLDTDVDDASEIEVGFNLPTE